MGAAFVDVVLLALVGLLIVWDVFLAAREPSGDTISERIRFWARRYSMIPFSFGVLVGHWFW